jgi:hypothetical protein
MYENLWWKILGDARSLRLDHYVPVSFILEKFKEYAGYLKKQLLRYTCRLKVSRLGYAFCKLASSEGVGKDGSRLRGVMEIACST